MTKFFLIIIGILLASLIFAILTILLQGKIYKGKLRKQEADFLNQYNDLQFRQQEILNNAKHKKDKLHSGSDSDNFNNSLDILRNLKNDRSKTDSDKGRISKSL